MNPLATNDSIKDKFAAIADANATMQKMVFKDDAGLPVGAAIFVLGVVETGEILTAIDAVEKTWNEGPMGPATTTAEEVKITNETK